MFAGGAPVTVLRGPRADPKYLIRLIPAEESASHLWRCVSCRRREET